MKRVADNDSRLRMLFLTFILKVGFFFKFIDSFFPIYFALRSDELNFEFIHLRVRRIRFFFFLFYERIFSIEITSGFVYSNSVFVSYGVIVCVFRTTRVPTYETMTRVELNIRRGTV